jgi:hypothetical protein
MKIQFWVLLAFAAMANAHHPRLPSPEDNIPTWLCVDYDESFLFLPPMTQSHPRALPQ